MSKRWNEAAENGEPQLSVPLGAGRARGAGGGSPKSFAAIAVANAFRLSLLSRLPPEPPELLRFLVVVPTRADDVKGVAKNIPTPARRNVMVQIFNWKIRQIEQVVPKLKQLGYSHVHVSLPQKSNEKVWQWVGTISAHQFFGDQRYAGK